MRSSVDQTLYKSDIQPYGLINTHTISDNVKIYYVVTMKLVLTATRHRVIKLSVVLYVVDVNETVYLKIVSA